MVEGFEIVTNRDYWFPLPDTKPKGPGGSSVKAASFEESSAELNATLQFALFEARGVQHG